MPLTAEQLHNRTEMVGQFMRREISWATLVNCWPEDDAEPTYDPPSTEELLDAIRLLLGKLALMAAEHPVVAKAAEGVAEELATMGARIEELALDANRNK